MEKKKKIFEAYAQAIAEQFHLSLDEMFENTKQRHIVDSRQMLYYMAYERPIRVSQIKRFLEEIGFNVSHSTILYGYKKAKELIDNDPDYKELVKKLKDVH